MKRLQAVVPVRKAEDLRRLLLDCVPGVTISDVGQTVGSDGQLVPEVHIDVVLEDDLVPNLLAVLTAAARAGTIGEGTVSLDPLDEVVRVRTGERGEDAL